MEIRRLVAAMAEKNPTWAYARIAVRCHEERMRIDERRTRRTIVAHEADPALISIENPAKPQVVERPVSEVLTGQPRLIKAPSPSGKAEVCKTSIPGSNPGGASNSKPHENHDLPNRPAWRRPAIWEQLGTIRVRALRSPCGARHRRRACRC